MIEIRPATLADRRALVAIDRATWSPTVTPAPLWDEDADFFGNDGPAGVLVAVRAGVPVGYVSLRPPTPLAANRHVLQITGLAVDPSAQRQGIGRRLVGAAVDAAAARGARRLTLRVLGHNQGALALYAGCGFVVEGRLPEEFRLAGAWVDDVLMGRRLDPAGGAAP